MAWGDAGRSQNAIGYQGGLAQNRLDNLRNTMVPQNQTIWNNYLNSYDKGAAQQGQLMDAYSQLAGSAGSMYNPAYSGFSGMAFGNAGGFDPEFRGNLSSAGKGYQNFADTGGYTPEGIAAMRARSLAPMRAAYADANRGVEKQKSLQGGYSPNYTAAKAKMAREMSQGLGDASMNVEAELASRINQGKLAGMQGLNQTAATGQGLQNSIDSMNAQSRIAGLSGMNQSTSAGLQAMLNALGGASNVYGSAPGLANMTQSGLMNSNNQLMGIEGMQNQLGLGIMNAQNQKAQIPGNFQQAVNIGGQLTNMAGNIGTGLGGFFPGGSNSGMSSVGTSFDKPLW